MTALSRADMIGIAINPYFGSINTQQVKQS